MSYKPLLYPRCPEFFDKQHSFFWLPHHIIQRSDGTHYSRMKEEDALCLQRVLTFFTQADINVQKTQLAAMRMFADRPEVIGMLTQFASIEDVHIRSYSMKVDEFMNVSDFYTKYKEIDVFKRKSDQATDTLDKDYDNNTPLLVKIEHLIEHFLFGEGVFLNTFFLLLLSYNRVHNILLGLDTIVRYSARDENLHVEGIQYLIKRTFEIGGFSKRKANEIVNEIVSRKKQGVLKDQLAILNYIYGEKHDLNGYTKEYMMQFTEWNYNRVTNLYGANINTIQIPEGTGSWLWMMNLISTSKVDIFSSGGGSYTTDKPLIPLNQ